MASLPSAVPGRYLLSNEQESAGVCLTLLQRPHPHGARLGAPSYDELLAAAAAVPAGQRRLDLHALAERRAHAGRRPNGAGRVRQPVARARRVRTWCARCSRGWRSTRGGCRSTWSGSSAGRSTRSRWWAAARGRSCGARSTRTSSDRPIRQAADPVMANARGAALQASVALGRLTWDDVPRPCADGADVRPRAGGIEGLRADVRGVRQPVPEQPKKIHARLNAGR